VTVCYRAAFYTDHVRGQSEILRDREDDGRKGLINLNATDIADLPAGAVER
jgi:hypothetical protein